MILISGRLIQAAVSSPEMFEYKGGEIISIRLQLLSDIILWIVSETESLSYITDGISFSADMHSVNVSGREKFEGVLKSRCAVRQFSYPSSPSDVKR